eukprot:Sspe_Gene.46241::Locus_23054_Transcript_1_1_Confidence_1.000_Length_844::g.46241::m.46241
MLATPELMDTLLPMMDFGGVRVQDWVKRSDYCSGAQPVGCQDRVSCQRWDDIDASHKQIVHIYSPISSTPIQSLSVQSTTCEAPSPSNKCIVDSPKIETQPAWSGRHSPCVSTPSCTEISTPGGETSSLSLCSRDPRNSSFATRHSKMSVSSLTVATDSDQLKIKRPASPCKLPSYVDSRGHYTRTPAEERFNHWVERERSARRRRRRMARADDCGHRSPVTTCAIL